MEQSYIIEMVEKGEISLRARSFMRHPAGYSIQRIIPDFDVLFTLAGRHFLTINGRPCVSDPGDVYLLTPDTILALRCEEEARQFYCHFTIRSQNQCSLTASFAENHLPPYCAGLAELYRRQFETSASLEMPLDSSVSLIFKLFLIEMLKAHPKNQISFASDLQNDAPDDIFETLYYIHSHLEENVTVEKLAEVAGFNPSYFSRYFKRHMGVSPVKYINEHKMNFARHFISTTDMPLKEVAAMLGYPDQFAFSKKFKDHFGVSPSEFRKINI